MISRTSVVQLAREGKTIPEIAAELRVDGVIEGSAMREGDQVRITVQLIDARSDDHVWAESYDREFSSALALTREVSRRRRSDSLGERDATLLGSPLFRHRYSGQLQLVTSLVTSCPDLPYSARFGTGKNL